MTHETVSSQDIRGSISTLTIADYQCSLYLPKQYNSSNISYFPVVYLLGESNILPIMQIVEKQFCPPFILLGIEAADWEKDFSPWNAEPLVKKSKPFTGGAPQFLLHLKQEIKPYIDSHFRTLPQPENTALAGYSLAGLTTLFALYTTNFAHNFASMSGSLWFYQWTDFCSKQSSASSNKFRIYLSLGNTEKNSRHPLMSQVDDCTQTTIARLKKQFPQSTDTIFFEYNNGGHFSEISSRIAKALVWLQKNYLYPADYNREVR